MVTSSEKNAALNFGLEKLLRPTVRYDIADEFVDIVKQLWNSREEGALVADTGTASMSITRKFIRLISRGNIFVRAAPSIRCALHRATQSFARQALRNAVVISRRRMPKSFWV